MRKTFLLILILFSSRISSQSEIYYQELINYKEAIQDWNSINDIHSWVSENFEYDFERAKRLSNNNKETTKVPIYKPEEFYVLKKGICVDLSRFAFESVKKVDSSIYIKYLKIKFEPLTIEGSKFVNHWLVAYKKNDKYYFFADSNRPKILAGPFNSIDEFIFDYEKFRKRNIESFNLLNSYRKKQKLKISKQVKIKQ